MGDNAHFILDSGLCLVSSFVFDNNIQIPVVAGVGCTGEDARDDLSFRDSHGCWGIEYSLSRGLTYLFISCRGNGTQERDYSLPMGVLCVWSSGELYLFVGALERDVKPCEECVNI